MTPRAGQPSYPKPLSPWMGFLWLLLCCGSALFLVTGGCEPEKVIAAPAENPTHLCHIEHGDWLTIGWVVNQRLYGDDHIMIFRTVHGCTCVLFLPDWLGVDGSAYADGELVTVRGQVVEGPDRLARLYVYGINEGTR